MHPLQMKDRCERCGSHLAQDGEAYICSFECTFCGDCASQLPGTCPNCGGGLARRPSRNGRPQIASADRSRLVTSNRVIRRVCLASFGIWSFITASSGLSMYEFDRSFGRSATLRVEFVLPAVNYMIFAFLTPFVFFLARRYPIQTDNWRRRVWLYFAGGLCFTVAHVVLRCVVYPVWDPRINGFTSAVWNSTTHAPQINWILFQRLFLYDTVDDIASTYLAIVLVAHAVWYYQNFRERETRATQLETQLTKARLKALKSQMQPHFLFNTMHSISALILTDVAAADKMITRLSDFLRISLANDEVQFTTLSRELEFVNGYLEIEKVRFEERLTVVFDIAPDTLDAHIPHLLLQPLVENAIRHGVSRCRGGGEISITSRREAGRLYLKVKDNGPGLTELERNCLTVGLGLKATRERLETIYGDDQSLDIRGLAEGGVEVELRLSFRSDSRPTIYGLGPSPQAAAD